MSIKIYCALPSKVFEILKRTKSKAKYSMGKSGSLFTTSLLKVHSQHTLLFLFLFEHFQDIVLYYLCAVVIDVVQ